MRVNALRLGCCAVAWAAGSSCTPEEAQAPEETTPDITIEASVAPTTGLIGEWKLDETGGTNAVDTKSGYNGTVMGGAAFVAGKLGNGLDLNNGTAGTGGKFVQLPSNATLDAVQEANYTISAWFFPYSAPPAVTNANQHWSVVTKAPFQTGLVYNHDGGFEVRHYLTGDTLKSTSSAASYPLNTWHHVAGVVNKTAGTLTLYVNGSSAGSVTFTAGTAAREYGTAQFGIGKGGSNWAADGKVDQVRIYDRALSAAEVSDLFNESAAGAGPTVTTNSANGIEQTGATLRGSANPNGANSTGWFRYSTTDPGSCNDSFGTRAPSTGGTALGSGTAAVAYTRAISNLTGGRVYYFCAIASSSAGVAFGTVQSFRAGGTGLRFGPAGLDPHLAGQGPGNDMVGPAYRYINEETPELTTDFRFIHEQIALAEQHDVVLTMAPSGPRVIWAPDGNYNPALYEAELRKWENDTIFRRAVNQRRVLLYVVDEPYHPEFHGTISPTEVNQMGAWHKEIWPGALTFVRVTGSILANGWNGMGPPAGGYTALDYGWVQWSGQHTDSTVTQVYNAEKAALRSLNMGMVPDLNVFTGGIGHLPGQDGVGQGWDGVLSCWDINDNNASSGYMVGSNQGAPYTEGQKFNCGSLPSDVTRLIAGPEWIKHWADVISSDPDAPFAAFWRHPANNQPYPDAAALIGRADFVSALDYAINKLGSRATWNGYRTPK